MRNITLLFAFLTIPWISAFGQTTVTTNYTAGTTTSLTGNAGIVFAIDNDNAVDIKITEVGHYTLANNTATWTLWYSTTEPLTGVPSSVTTANGWTEVTPSGQSATNTGADGIITVLTGIDVEIPANTAYRFALESSNGLNYGGATMTPNVFTEDDVSLWVGDNSNSPGYTGAFPNLTVNTPRFFYGYITFEDVENPDCLSPQDLSLDNVAHDGAEFSWDASPDETGGYDWAVMDEGEHPDTDTPVQSGNTGTGVTDVTVTGLAPETAYDFYVQTDCGSDGPSVWKMIGFETLVACPPPSGLQIADATGTTADISWDASSNESDGYLWAVMVSGEHPDNDIPVVDGTTDPGETEAAVTGLQPETLYHVYVRADCGTGFGLSSWEGPLTLLTPEFDCPMPTAPETQVDGTAVTVIWTEPEPAPDDGYYWELFYTDDDPETDPPIDSDTASPGMTSVEITGLEEQTAYRLRLYALCVEESTPPIVSNPWNLLFTSGTTVGIDANTIPGFNFWPNPATDVLNIEADGLIENIVMYNLHGQRVLEQNTNTNTATLDCSRLADGTYMLQVTANGQTGIFRVVKR